MGGEITPDSVRQVLFALASRNPINIFLNSEGGSVTDALAIYDLILHRNVTVIALGQCCSAALLVLLGGSKRLATPHCRFMAHAVGTSGEAISSADSLEEFNLTTTVGSIIRARTGSELRLSEDKLYFGSAEALRLGIVHKIWNAIPARSVSPVIRSIQ